MYLEPVHRLLSEYTVLCSYYVHIYWLKFKLKSKKNLLKVLIFVLIKLKFNVRRINVLLLKILIGFVSALIIFPPSFLIVQLFRRSKKRTTRSVALTNAIKKNNEKAYIENNRDIKESKVLVEKKKSSEFLLLPWWFKIVSYLLSFVLVLICAFFIIIKGITFGDEQCRKWLTSFLVSALTGCFLIQPLQVKASSTSNSKL